MWFEKMWVSTVLFTLLAYYGERGMVAKKVIPNVLERS